MRCCSSHNQSYSGTSVSYKFYLEQMPFSWQKIYLFISCKIENKIGLLVKIRMTSKNSTEQGMKTVVFKDV